MVAMARSGTSQLRMAVRLASVIATLLEPSMVTAPVFACQVRSRRATLVPKAPASTSWVVQLPLGIERAVASGVWVCPEAMTSMPVTWRASSTSSPVAPVASVPECESTITTWAPRLVRSASTCDWMAA